MGEMGDVGMLIIRIKYIWDHMAVIVLVNFSACMYLRTSSKA